jgi:phage N-6-adenine-methyltransferase
MNTATLFSSATDQWSTPSTFFKAVEERLGQFDLDVCADVSNTKCTAWYGIEQDGLKQRWLTEGKSITRCWMNPPYGRVLKDWVHKACVEVTLGGVEVVLLVPARTDTKWFQEAWQHASCIWFIKGRLRFGDAKASAPFPSALIELVGNEYLRNRQVSYW